MPVIVNQREITDEEVFNEMQYHPAATRSEAMELAAKALVVRELLIQEAIANGILDEQDALETGINADDKRIADLLTKEIKTPQADEASCKMFYENNKKKFIKNDGSIAEFDAVHQVIVDYLTDSSWQIAVRQYIKILAGKAKISGVDFEMSDSPLTQ